MNSLLSSTGTAGPSPAVASQSTPLFQTAFPAFQGLTTEQQRERFNRATKIVSTLGPQTASEEKIAALIESGVNVFRLNFSHGDHEYHSRLLASVRKVAARYNVVVGVLQDLCGPKTRIGLLPDKQVELKKGEEISLVKGVGPFAAKDGRAVISTELFDPTQVLKVDQKVFLADARLELRVKRLEADGAVLEVVRGGILREKVGIAVPDTELGLPAYSEKDLRDLEWGIRNNVDFVALSFVETAEDVIGLRREMKARGGDIPIIAKIERKGALARLDEICSVSNGVMVARGDLGVDIPFWEVPDAQRNIIAAAQRRGIPVIVATQMMPSMVSSDQPSRCEAQDVYNGARYGVDGVMTSEETAIGQYPAETISAMSKISSKGELQFRNREFRKGIIGDSKFACEPAESIAVAAAYASMGERYHAVVVCTETGETARLVAKHRPEVPIYGISSKPSTLRRMTLLWGVNPIEGTKTVTAAEERDAAFRLVAEQYFKSHPEQQRFGAIIVGGAVPGIPYSSSLMECREVSRSEFEALIDHVPMV